jgi:hypothetical protein
MLEHLPQALSSLGAASTIAKTMLELRDFQHLNNKVIELQQIIISAQKQVLSGQGEQTALAAKVNELEKECARLKDWSSEQKRYTCREIGEGVFAYLANDSAGNLQSAHKLCCNCFDSNIKSTLQQSREPQRMIGLVCPNGCPKLVFTHYL